MARVVVLTDFDELAFFNKWKRSNIVWQFRIPDVNSLQNINIFDVAVIYTENDFLLAKILLNEIKHISAIPVVLILNHEYMNEMINLQSDVIVLSDANEYELACRILRQVNIKNIQRGPNTSTLDYSNGSAATGSVPVVDIPPAAPSNSTVNSGSTSYQSLANITGAPPDVDASGKNNLRFDSEDGPFEAAPGLVISHDKYSAKVNGEPIVLTFTEFRILYILTKTPGKVYSRNDIALLISNKNEQNINLRSIDVHVRRVRAKLGIKYGSFLKSMHGVGYYWEVG